MLIRKETRTKTITVDEIIFTHRCDVCGREYTSQHDWLNWCSDTCAEVIKERKRKAAIKRSTQRRKERREEAKKALPDSICVNCQEAFKPVRSDTKFCSTKCKQSAYRKRKAEV